MQIIAGLWIPFLGTALGAAFIFVFPKNWKKGMESCMMGFASGVMVAGAIWSLLLPAIELENNRGSMAFFPAAMGYAMGMLFLLVTQRVNQMFLQQRLQTCQRRSLMAFSVTLHNIPEGMCVGAAFAAWLSGRTSIGLQEAYLLAIGIGIQNIPEGFLVALPGKKEGKSKLQCCIKGMGSGLVEPLAGGLMVLFTAKLIPYLSYLLAFSAGAMFYVILDELLLEAVGGEKKGVGMFGFSAGFLLMMILDVALG